MSQESVRAVAHSYGVDPEVIARYGPKPFPVNYIGHTLGWKWEQAENPVIYRREVESLVTGYVSKCEIADTTTLYLYYSNRLRPKTLFKGEALPVVVRYKLDPQRNGIHDDQVLEQITFYDIGDSGGLPWEQVAPSCVPPAILVTTDYIFGAQRVAMRQAGVVSWLLGDHLRSTSLTLNSSGTKVGELRYKAYGETRYTWGTTPTDHRFTDQLQDSYIKLVKMGSRWYDPELGRWISPDTTVPEPENPQAFNRYSYVEGNPCRYVDMTGHWKFDVHHTHTQQWVREIEIKVYAYRNTPLDVMPDNLYDAIADANNDVDVDAIRNLVIHGGRKWGQTPNSSLGGAAPEQYYHYASKADAEARLMEAISAKDATAFGKALHSYQDYYAHTLNGFTALPGDVGSLFSNCSECLYGESLLTLMERAEGLGHDGVSWPDKFDLGDQRAIDMMNGTKWYASVLAKLLRH